MSTFDIEVPEEVWPVGIPKNIQTVKKNLLQGMKKSITETKALNKYMVKSLATNDRNFSPQSVEFLDNVISMQTAPKEKKKYKRKSERVVSNSEACVRLETLLKRLLYGIVKDTYTASKEPEIEEMHQELVQLFNSMMETQEEGPVLHEYSPKLEAVLSRIAIIGLVTLDSSNRTLEFEL